MVELEYASLSQWKQDEISHGRLNMEVLIITNPETNTITPIKIEYEKYK